MSEVLQFPSEVLMDLRERMVRIETKLDVHADNHTSVKASLESHDARLDKIESNFKLAAGVGSVLLGIVTFFQDPILSLFH